MEKQSPRPRLSPSGTPPPSLQLSPRPGSVSPRGAAPAVSPRPPSPRGAVQLRARLAVQSRESGFEDRAEPVSPGGSPRDEAAPAARLPSPRNKSLARVRDRSRAVEGGPPVIASRADWKPLQQFGKPRRNSLCAMFTGDPVLRMVQLLCEHSFYVERVAHMVDSSDTQRLADALVNVSVPFGRTLFLVKAMIESEFQQNKTQVASIMRGNCVASKLMGAFSFFVGMKFLDSLVGRIVRDIVHEGERLQFEVDPSRVASSDAREANRNLLTQWALRLVDSITSLEVSSVPDEICAIAKFTAENARQVCPENLSQLVGGYLILRLINPVLVAPEAYGVTPSPPSQHARRNLTLLSKLLQNISNGSVSASKEPYMAVFSDFVKSQTERLGAFLTRVVDAGVDTTSEPAIPVEQADVGFLQGRHLAFLHTLLTSKADDLSKELAALPRNTLKELELMNILPLVTREQAAAKPADKEPVSPWICAHLRSGYITKMGDKKRKKHKRRYRLEVTRYLLFFFEEDANGPASPEGSTQGKLVKVVPMIGMTVSLKQVKRDAILELVYHGRAHSFVNHENSESVAAWAQSLQAASEFDGSRPQVGNDRFVNVPSKGAVADVLTAFHNWPRLNYTVNVSADVFVASPVPAVTVHVAAFDCKWDVTVTLADALAVVESLQKEVGSKIMVPPPPHVLTRDAKRSTGSNRLDYGLYVSASGSPSAGLLALRYWLEAFLCAVQSNPFVSHSRAILSMLDLDSPFRAASHASMDHMRWIRRYITDGLAVKNSNGVNVLMHLVSDPHATLPGHAELIKFLVDSRAVDLKDVDNDGNSALHRAIIAKSNQHALLLCEMGSDHLPNTFLQYPLHLVASTGSDDDSTAELVDVCFKSKPESLLETDRKGRTPLHLAVVRKAGQMATQLLALVPRAESLEQQRPLFVGTPQNSLLHLAIVNGLDNVATILIRDRLIDCGSLNLDGQSALHVAALFGNWPASELLIKMGLDGKVRDKRNMTPLMCAALGGNADIFKALLPVSDPLVVDDDRRSLIHCVAEGGNVECMKLVLELEGQGLNAVDAVGRTPLHYACKGGAADMIRLLLERGAAASVPDKSGQTPLLHAARANSCEACKVLIEQGHVDIKEVDRSRHDALYYAVEAFDSSKGTELVSYLLSAGMKPHNLLYQAASKGSLPLILMLANAKADPNAVDRKSGSTALHVAVQKGNLPMVMALLNAGAWPTVKNHAGETPLSMAIASKRKELVVVFANFDKAQK